MWLGKEPIVGQPIGYHARARHWIRYWTIGAGRKKMGHNGRDGESTGLSAGPRCVARAPTVSVDSISRFLQWETWSVRNSRNARPTRSELGPGHCEISVMIVALSDLCQHGKFVSVLKPFGRRNPPAYVWYSLLPLKPKHFMLWSHAWEGCAGSK